MDWQRLLRRHLLIYPCRNASRVEANILRLLTSFSSEKGIEFTGMFMGSQARSKEQM